MRHVGAVLYFWEESDAIKIDILEKLPFFEQYHQGAFKFTIKETENIDVLVKSCELFFYENYHSFHFILEEIEDYTLELHLVYGSLFDTLNNSITFSYRLISLFSDMGVRVVFQRM